VPPLPVRSSSALSNWGRADPADPGSNRLANDLARFRSVRAALASGWAGFGDSVAAGQAVCGVGAGVSVLFSPVSGLCVSARPSSPLRGRPSALSSSCAISADRSRTTVTPLLPLRQPAAGVAAGRVIRGGARGEVAQRSFRFRRMSARRSALQPNRVGRLGSSQAGGGGGAASDSAQSSLP